MHQPSPPKSSVYSHIRTTAQPQAVPRTRGEIVRPDRGRDSVEKIPPPVAHESKAMRPHSCVDRWAAVSQPTLQAHSLFSPSSSGGISSSPESAITTVLDVFPDWLPTASTALTTFIDSSSDTLPKTTWRPSSHAASRRTGRARQGRARQAAHRDQIEGGQGDGKEGKSPVRLHARYAPVLTVQIKNCEPLVPGPALAIERVPGPVCLSLKFSSANFSP